MATIPARLLCLPQNRTVFGVRVDEPDPYAAAMIERVLAADGRLRRCAAGERADLCLYSADSDEAFDALETRLRLADEDAPPILLMSAFPDPRLVRLLQDRDLKTCALAGYGLKHELACSLGWALLLTWQGYTVLTPGTRRLLPGPMPRRGIVCRTPGLPPAGGQAGGWFRQVLAPMLAPGCAAAPLAVASLYRAATLPYLAQS